MRIDGIAALQQAATNYRTHGAARVVACFHGVVALGMSGGAAFVLLPRGLSAEGGPEVSSGPRYLICLGFACTRKPGYCCHTFKHWTCHSGLPVNVTGARCSGQMSYHGRVRTGE